MLLTGDNGQAASTIADKIGISKVNANLMPEDKMQIIKDHTDRKICMVGDGVNDALALSTAYAGIAMGGVGSDIAVESADAVLVSDDIQRLPYLFKITQRSHEQGETEYYSLATDIMEIYRKRSHFIDSCFL